MRPDCTLITSCFDLTKYHKGSRTLEECINNMKSLLEVPCYLVIFTDNNCINLIKEIRNSFDLHDITHYIVCDFEKIEYYKYNDIVKSNRAINWPTKDERTCSESHILVCNKFNFVLQIIKLNPFNTTTFGWIDSSLGSKSMRICENYTIDKFINVLNNISEKFQIQILNVNDKKYKLNENKKEYYQQYRWVVCGGFFTTGKEMGEKILSQLNKIFIKTTEMGYGHGEEMLYLEILDDFYDDIEKSYGDYGQIINNYSHPTCNLSYIYYNLIQKYLNFGYNKECYDCCEKVLYSIEKLNVSCEPFIYFNTLFCYYVSSFYHKQSQSVKIVNHIYDICNNNPIIKSEFNKNKIFYDSQFKYCNELKPKYKMIVNIFACATVEKYKQEIIKINETWGKKAEENGIKILFFLGEEKTDLINENKYIYLKDVENDYESAAYKQNLGLKYIYENYNADFVFTCGTDTYINIDKLLLYINQLDKNKKLYIGGHGDYRIIGNDNVYFHSGGAGFILSNSVSSELYPQLCNIQNEWENICLINNVEYLITACDVLISYYVGKIIDIEIIKNKNFYSCNHKGLCYNSTLLCCGKKVNVYEIISCHNMTMRDFDELTLILENNNFFVQNMESINSFDIFDTLIARTVKNPTDIFNIVERRFPYSNFKNIRLISQDKSNHTIENIYLQFKLLTNETDEIINKLREFELQIEMENTIPIISNISKIKDTDIFVSDMYLSNNDIMKLLNYHGINLNKNIKLYVSPSGKSSGHIWNKLLQEYNIINHTGDNYHSDIEMSSRYGINGIYTEIYKFSNLEEKLSCQQNESSTIFRKFRLMNPYSENTFEYKLYEAQIIYNIPLLLFMCRQLANILLNENKKKVLFLSRDGCLIYKLFSLLYPNYEACYMYSSRIINENYNDEYINYLKKIYNEDECILFDLHGSFKSGRKLFIDTFGSLPRIFIFDLSIKENYYDKMTYITNTSSMIESFNHDINGSLIDYKDNQTIHLPSELSLKHIKVIDETIDNFITYAESDGIKLNLKENDIFNEITFWKEYYNDIVSKQIQLIYNNREHDKQTLTFLANKYNSDKGNSFKCAHHYTIKYQEIISCVLKNKVNNKKFENIDLLEIGLNRDNSESIPSLLMWYEYFNKNINITGFDIDINFSKFDSLHNNIKIVIGDQSNENDLNKLKYKTYDIIIDDGYHASKHQQISFKALWSSVKLGGYYIIEDLHYQPTLEACIKTKQLFEQWKDNNWVESEFINNIDIKNIKNDIESINFYDSKSKLWPSETIINAFVYIKKK